MALELAKDAEGDFQNNVQESAAIQPCTYLEGSDQGYGKDYDRA